MKARKKRKAAHRAYTCIDRIHNVWRCVHCGHIEQFEADGPIENGWNLCPSCGKEVGAEKENDKERA